MPHTQKTQELSVIQSRLTCGLPDQTQLLEPCGIPGPAARRTAAKGVLARYRHKQYSDIGSQEASQRR